ncbi:hypothetical protein [Paenibacillus psychroresistens]|uniref:hypothetical protein n=1 Tax=Paenibacillus psychroresistens TaxID=1778678 RepID=UPI001D056335|nr:hypothetical protein [Paenibacillus psychroresistens]
MVKIMDKKKIFTVLLGASLLFLVFTYYTTSADGAAIQPGSVNDPAVTKSYVDEQVKLQVAAQIKDQANKDVSAQIEELKKAIAALSGGKGTSSDLTVVQLAPGQTLMAEAGSEVIVRNGYVTAVSNDGNGIPDVTGGKDIAVNAAIATNHLLIFPTDKRGVKPDPKKTDTIFLMVRGEYKLISGSGAVKATPSPTPIATPDATPTATPTAVPTAGSTNAPVISP